MSTLQRLGVLVLFTNVVGCAAALPPKELVNARTEYQRASTGPAAQYDPADVHASQEELTLAEASFKSDGDTLDTRDHSYLATRKAELAEVVGRTLQNNQAKNGIMNAMYTDEKNAVASASAELGRTKVQLQDETSRREAAERRAAQAASDLAKFATVKQEPRGMVITLSGSVLFASAKWDLFPEAQLKLNDVANALTKEDPLSKIVVEGYTDSQGALAYNQDLSQHRAQTVRDYLVTRGIASDRISAKGFGPSVAIADNGSAEGRANNRRVEIVVMPTNPAR